jgi:hypothetical protein
VSSRRKDNPTTLVADVDCTAGGKPLCDQNGVRGFPSLKYGAPDDLQEYKVSAGKRLEDSVPQGWLIQRGTVCPCPFYGC